MANIKVLKTNGNEGEILKNTESPVVHLFISALSNCEETHELGDVLLNETSDTRFALVVKEEVNGKIQTHALRLAILKMLKTMVENETIEYTFLISRHQFSNRKEEQCFICILKEFCITYFGEVFTEDISLVITDYTE